MRKVEVWPVIHVVEQGLTLRNAGLAHRLGAAGVLMISMRGRDWEARARPPAIARKPSRA